MKILIRNGRVIDPASGRDEVAELILGVHDGKPVMLSDVADVRAGIDVPASYVWHGAPAGMAGPKAGIASSVSTPLPKRPP